MIIPPSILLKAASFINWFKMIARYAKFRFEYLWFFLALSLFSFFRQKCVSYDPCDLLARYFGVFLGIAIGLISSITALLAFGIINFCFSFWNSAKKQPLPETTEAVPSEESSASPVEATKDEATKDEATKEPLYSRFGRVLKWIWGYILFPLLWIAITILSSALIGFFQGFCLDSNYASCNSSGKSVPDNPFLLNSIFVICILIALQIWLLVKNKSTSCSRRHFWVRLLTGIVFILFPIAATFSYTRSLCQLSIPYTERELESGVYLYTNDTAYSVKVVNIYSSRCGGFAHSGFCLITKDPRGENAQRKKLGLKPLRFVKLDRGYYVNLLSMAVPDQDGFTNYESRCYPMENTYQFDANALKNYLAGHSPNDLPAPALRMKKLSTNDYRKTWNRIVEFGNRFNKLFPEGMIYSPIPFTDEHVITINCNTFSASILDTLIKEKLIDANDKQTVKEFEKLIDPRFSFGGQTLADGQKLNEFLAQDDASEQVDRHWKFVKEAPLEEQNFWANVLRTDGYGKSLSKLVNKPKG